MQYVDAARLERRREQTVKSRSLADRHPYFQGVAEARYVLRKVFRMVEEEARRAGVEPLAHQALIQIYGSPGYRLRVKEVADRLDITPAFASSLVKALVEQGYVQRERDKTDNRVIWVKVTKAGRQLLHSIDEQVQIHVDYFTANLDPKQTEAALSVLMFYVGVSIKAP